MRCLKCGGELAKEKGSLVVNRDFIGNFTIDNVNYKKCDDCGNLRFPAATAKRIEEKELKIREALIGKLPANEFIGATAAAEILGITRQAMHKQARIRRGFIYSIKIDNKNFYHTRSIKLYKEKGDGRFQLTTSTQRKEVKYIMVSTKPRMVKRNPATWGSNQDVGVYQSGLTNFLSLRTRSFRGLCK